MKLYKLERGTKFTILEEDNKCPIDGCGEHNLSCLGECERTLFLFHHVDGMYSYCTRVSDDKVFHIIAYAEVEEVYV